jgi:putative hydrolase of the HAD superfamily
MFQAALQHAGVGPREIVHVGDNPEHDIQGAKEVGMHAIWMNSQGEKWPGGPQPDCEIANLTELPAAIASLDSGP